MPRWRKSGIGRGVAAGPARVVDGALPLWITRGMMRRLGIILVALLLVLAAAHAALWWVATGRLRSEAEAWAAAERAAGNIVTHGRPARGGYPLLARLTLPGFRHAGAVALPGGAAVAVDARARAVTLVLAPEAPGRLGIEIVCPCEGGTAGAPPMPLDAAELRAEVPLLRGAAGPTLTGRDLVLYLPDGPLSVAEVRARVPDPSAATVSADAFGVVLPPPEAQWPLGPRIASASAEVTLRGALPPGPSPARALAAWRDRDGALLLDRVSLAWGPLTVRGAATVALDQALQPRGAATAMLAGYGPTLDRLVAAGVLARGQAALLRLGLAAASRPGEGGERVVDIALALEDRTLSVARIPVARLPPVVWPDAAR